MHTPRRKYLLLPSFLLILTLGATSPESWQLIDKFKNVSVGEWVKLKYSGGSEHLLLVAEKDHCAITLEERVLEEGYVTSWTQIVIDLKKKSPVLFRERLPAGGIRQIKIENQKPNPDDEFHALLTARFQQDPGTQRVIVPAGKFSCKVYHAVYNKRFIKIFFSEKIPLYPVKVLIPGYNLTIRLVAFGKEMESHFFPKAEKSPHHGGAENPAASR